MEALKYTLSVEITDRHESTYTTKELEFEIRRALKDELYLGINNFKLEKVVEKTEEKVAEPVAGKTGRRVPHCPELNAPGELGCICLECVKSRIKKPAKIRVKR